MVRSPFGDMKLDIPARTAKCANPSQRPSASSFTSRVAWTSLPRLSVAFTSNCPDNSPLSFTTWLTESRFFGKSGLSRVAAGLDEGFCFFGLLLAAGVAASFLL